MNGDAPYVIAAGCLIISQSDDGGREESSKVALKKISVEERGVEDTQSEPGRRERTTVESPLAREKARLHADASPTHWRFGSVRNCDDVLNFSRFSVETGGPHRIVLAFSKLEGVPVTAFPPDSLLQHFSQSAGTCSCACLTMRSLHFEM